MTFKKGAIVRWKEHGLVVEGVVFRDWKSGDEFVVVKTIGEHQDLVQLPLGKITEVKKS